MQEPMPDAAQATSDLPATFLLRVNNSPGSGVCKNSCRTVAP
jgi:hypothetical protein